MSGCYHSRSTLDPNDGPSEPSGVNLELHDREPWRGGKVANASWLLIFRLPKEVHRSTRVRMQNGHLYRCRQWSFYRAAVSRDLAIIEALFCTLIAAISGQSRRQAPSAFYLNLHQPVQKSALLGSICVLWTRAICGFRPFGVYFARWVDNSSAHLTGRASGRAVWS